MNSQHTLTTPPTEAHADAVMTHREVLEAMSGLLLGMLVAILSSTVVSTSLPVIIGDLHGSESAYTWVVTSTLLAMTVSTPIWGKFADLFSRKLLLQLSLVVFVFGSALAGLSQSSGQLIGFRVIQGIGAGGLTALVQVVLADIVSPRERGRYMGYLGAVMAVGTVGGPLLGGVITDTISWRWNFYIGVPIAVLAIAVLQKTLHLPSRDRRKVDIDYLGVTLISAGVSLLLVWVTLGGVQFSWVSWISAAMVAGSVLAAVVLVWHESRASEPLIPLVLFRNRTVVLAIIASVGVGTAIFGASVYLSQYMQLSRGKTPMVSGLLTIPLIGGLLIASTTVGQVISRTGIWKRYMVTGGVLLTLGMVLMSQIRVDTGWIYLAVSMAILGAGIGLVMQNLVLVVQNVLPVRMLGSGSSSIAFFRTLGGAVGVSALGALLAHRVTSMTNSGLSALGIAPTGNSNEIPNLGSLPPQVRTVVETAYGHGIGNVFLAAIPLAAMALVAIALLPNRPLGTRSGVEQLVEETGEPASLPSEAGAESAERPSSAPDLVPSGGTR